MEGDVDKLHLVLDYLPCTPCKEIPSKDQKYLCTICQRLNRTVARKCTIIRRAVPLEDRVCINRSEWEKVIGLVGTVPVFEQSGDKIYVNRKDWESILDRIEQQSLQQAPPPEEPPWPEMPPEAPPEMPSIEPVYEDIEVVKGITRGKGFEILPEEVEFIEVKEEPAEFKPAEEKETGFELMEEPLVEVKEVEAAAEFESAPVEEPKPEEIGEFMEEVAPELRTGVKFFTGPDADKDIERWAESEGAQIKKKIPVYVKR